MGLSCPHTLQKCFRILDPPSLHPPPPSLGIHGLCTSWPLSPDNFTHIGLGLDNFRGICFLPCPRLPLATTVQLSGMGAPGQWGHRALTDVVEASRGQALRQMRRVEERGQEGHGHVLLVVHGGFVLCTLPGEQEYLQVFKETPSLNMDSLRGPTV